MRSFGGGGPRLGAALLALVTLALAVGGTAGAAVSSLPSVSSGHRPGPDVLYMAPPRAPQLDTVAPWTAPPILVSGAAAYRNGEYLYQDYVYDDRGARGLQDPNDPFDGTEFLFSPKWGTLTYPTDPVFANNAADLVELRVKPLATATAFRVTLNTMKDPARSAFTIALGSSTSPRTWPHGAGVESPAALFLTVHGNHAELIDAGTGTPRTPAPTATVGTVRRQIDVRIPHAAWNPGRGKVRMAAGVGLWDAASGGYAQPQASASTTKPGGRAPSGAALFNMAFRFHEHRERPANAFANTFVEGGAGYAIEGSWWRERTQGDVLADGDVSQFSADVDFGKLADRVEDDSAVPKSGFMDRLYASRFVFGQGVDYDNDCGGLTEVNNPCVPRFVGQLHNYGFYVPAKSPRRYGITLLLHGLSANHNEFLKTRHESQFGERGTGSLIAEPYGRGPDGFYQDIAEADVFEVWADVARNFRLDRRWAAISGYSMGGIGTYRLMMRYPDLFGRGAPVVGFAQDMNDQLPSLRNTPLIAWNAGQDELVNPALYEPTLGELGSLGLRFTSQVFDPAGHITIGANDEFGPMAAFLGTHRANRSPAHVTYVVGPATDSKRAFVVADHAYWTAGLRLRDSKASPTGTIDARSAAFGVGDPKPSGVQPGAGALTGGTRPALPFVLRKQEWGPAPRRARRNRLDVDLTNLGRATVDGRRARLVGTKALTVHVHSDGRGRLRLNLPLPKGARVERTSGSAVSGAAHAAASASEVDLDRHGATIAVASGTRTYVIRPPRSAGNGGGGDGGGSGGGGSGGGGSGSGGSGGGGSGGDGSGGQAAAGGGGGSLPFTGLAIGLVVGIGFAFSGSGRALRRRVRG